MREVNLNMTFSNHFPPMKSFVWEVFIGCSNKLKKHTGNLDYAEDTLLKFWAQKEQGQITSTLSASYQYVDVLG